MSATAEVAAQFPEKNRIAIVACSAFATDDAMVERGVERLQALGFAVDNYYHTSKKFQRFGAADFDRTAQLHDAISRSDIDYVLALRGGYGMSRLLPFLDVEKVAASGKILIGHSDFTALQAALLAQTNYPSIAGPMLCDDFGREDVSELTMQHFIDVLSGKAQQVALQLNAPMNADLEGILWGGNLAMLTHLVGTEFFPKVEGGILFLEDIAEHPFRIERMLLQLHFAGVLERQQAIVLGDFSGYKLADRDNGYNFDEMLKYIRSVVKVPIFTGLPFGHIKDKMSLRHGSTAQIRVTDQTMTLNF